jgi:hypothetical protein
LLNHALPVSVLGILPVWTHNDELCSYVDVDHAFDISHPVFEEQDIARVL